MTTRTGTLLIGLVAVVTGCDQTTAPRTEFHPRIERTTCDLDQDLFLAITNWDAIPSVDSPNFVGAESALGDYLAPGDRVVGFFVAGQPFAVPHNVLWHHEIVNVDSQLGPIAITYCPLTGSSIGYNRTNADGEPFGVTGFLYQNNLVMFDRQSPNSIWVQMGGEAVCGPKKGTPLTHYPVFDMRWDAWLELNPSTRVFSENQEGIGRDYTAQSYPYSDYEDYSYDGFLFPDGMPELDRTRPVKERILGIPATSNAAPMAFPFDALTALPGERQVIQIDRGGVPGLVLWSDAARSGMAFRTATLSGDTVDLEPGSEGFVDRHTGSVFDLTGRARSGPLEGTELFTINEAYVAFWGAWAAFHPGTELWTGTPES